MMALVNAVMSLLDAGENPRGSVRIEKGMQSTLWQTIVEK